MPQVTEPGAEGHLQAIAELPAVSSPHSGTSESEESAGRTLRSDNMQLCAHEGQMLTAGIAQQLSEAGLARQICLHVTIASAVQMKKQMNSRTSTLRPCRRRPRRYQP